MVGVTPGGDFPNSRAKHPTSCAKHPTFCAKHTQQVVPNTQHFVPNTQNFEAKHLKSCSTFSKISEQSPNILGDAPSSLKPSGSTAEPPLCAQWGQMPVTDRAWAIGNLRIFFAPSEHFPQFANLQWSVCLHVAQSENTPPQVLVWRARFLISSSIPPPRGASAGFALSGANTTLLTTLSP